MAVRLSDYYQLAKPGIVYGNALTTAAAFLYASGWQAWFFGGWGKAMLFFFATLLGISLIIASACVFNNWLDQDIDRRMERTRMRPLAAGRISAKAALIYGAALGLIGLALLASFVNLLTASLALFGWIMYVFAYGWAKRRGWWGALVGTVPGAVPIVVGYTAVAGRADAPALLLFLIMIAWQLPHFYAIAMFRNEEYAAAGIPTLANVLGMRAAKDQSFLFIFIFLLFALLPFSLGYAGYTYGIVMLALGMNWIWRATRGSKKKSDADWGRSIFLFSLVVLLGFSVILALSPVLP